MIGEVRGSDKLLAQLGGDWTLPENAVSKVVEFLRQGDFKLIDWQCYGQPKPEVLSGAFQVSREQVGGAVQRFLENDEVRFKLELFPIGIPWPDWFRVEFESHGPAGRG